ncbi:hypothetical protein OIV83_006042 [Microbotryomycetes sp. JL201]|nr:hypothetical protein OIV83_006042 [Microbotryomycetes sp. JL201]
MPFIGSKQSPLPTYTPPVSGSSTPLRYGHHQSSPPSGGAIAEKIALSYSNNQARHGATSETDGGTGLRRRIANCFAPMRIKVGSQRQRSAVTSREIVIPVLAFLHPSRSLPGMGRPRNLSKRRDSHNPPSSTSNALSPSSSPVRILIALVGTIIVIFLAISTSVRVVKPVVRRLTRKTQMPWSEPSTLVFAPEEVERIWRWEIASGQYPSRRPIDIQLGFDARTRQIENPGMPKRSDEDEKREREVQAEVQRRLRDQAGSGKARSGVIDSPPTEIVPVGPARTYLDVPRPRGSHGIDVRYPSRPRLGVAIDLDGVMEHCDFATDRYVRDCLEVLRANAGLSTTPLRRGIADSWKMTYVTNGAGGGSTGARTRDVLEAHRRDMTTLLRNSSAPNFASLLASRQQLTLSSSLSTSPHPSHPTADPACDPDYPHLFHIFWAGPFTDKPYAAALSFLYTQNLRLSRPIGAPAPKDVCRPQLWIWINPGPASSLPDKHAVTKMRRDLFANPWSAPLLHKRFEDVIKFRLWNTTEQLDGVSEMAGWRDMALFNSGGVKYGGKQDLHAQDDEQLGKRGSDSDDKIAKAEQQERDAGLATDSAEAALSSARDNQDDAPSAANATGIAAPLPTKARDELFERVGSTSTKYDRLTVVLSDMARFVLTHRFGGVYLDADTLLLRDWEELFNWHGSFAYRWSRLEKYNTAVLKMQRGSAIGNFLFRTAVANGLDFHPMTISRYTKDAKLEGLLLRLPDALFDPAWLNTRRVLSTRPSAVPLFEKVGLSKGAGVIDPADVQRLDRFEDFFETPKEIAAAPSAVGFEGFFQGSFSYHYHNGWWMPFDASRNFPDLGPRFKSNERLARGRLLAAKLAEMPASLRSAAMPSATTGPSPTKPNERPGATAMGALPGQQMVGPTGKGYSAGGVDDNGHKWGDDERDFDSLDWSNETVDDDQRDLSWSAVLKRTFESFVRGESPNMYGEWLSWDDTADSSYGRVVDEEGW